MICEVYIGIRHYEASFNQKKANRSTAFVALCIKGLKLELKEKTQQYFEGSFYMFEKKNEQMFLFCTAFSVYDKSFASHISCVDGLFTH